MILNDRYLVKNNIFLIQAFHIQFEFLHIFEEALLVDITFKYLILKLKYYELLTIKGNVLMYRQRIIILNSIIEHLFIYLF